MAPSRYDHDETKKHRKVARGSSVLASVLLMLATVASTSVVVVVATNDAGRAFLEENRGKAGVVTTASGLQYKILREGDGAHHPAVGTSCSCHYEGRLIDGTVFDSSYDRGSPTTFAPNQVIAGWTEAMQLMVEGDEWELYIPSELGYGERGSPPKIGGGDALVFRLEMLGILGDDKVPASRCRVTTAADGGALETSSACNERETNYVAKIDAWDLRRTTQERERLESMRAGKMRPDLLAWINRRLHILQQVELLLDDQAEL